ncbi:MAG: UDP-glucuronic acid dehydrogenase [Colwellia sp.]|nr:UDP-glucuronic acid dehydrogenase [Colwellia sp.]
MLKISIICSDPEHPVNIVLNDWIEINRTNYELQLVECASNLREQGDFLFLISCSEFVKKNIRDRFNHTLVLHASDLPHGRGWSPHIWEILNGAQYITLTLLEAADSIDSGKIWVKEQIPLAGSELLEEINTLLFTAEIKLIEFAINQYVDITPAVQPLNISPSYYPKRNPKDSRIDINKTLDSQFNLLRVCDNERFPAFFERNGYHYAVKIENLGKIGNRKND